MPKGIGYGPKKKAASSGAFTKRNVKVMRRAVRRAAAKRKAT